MSASEPRGAPAAPVRPLDEPPARSAEPVRAGQAELSDWRRRAAMLTVCLGVTLTGLDGAIANIALPTIARDLHVTPADSVWVVNAYQLAVAVCLMPLSSLGEILG